MSITETRRILIDAAWAMRNPGKWTMGELRDELGRCCAEGHVGVAGGWRWDRSTITAINLASDQAERLMADEAIEQLDGFSPLAALNDSPRGGRHAARRCLVIAAREIRSDHPDGAS